MIKNYAKPEIHEIGAAAEYIKGYGVGGDLAQGFPPALALEEIED